MSAISSTLAVDATLYSLIAFSVATWAIALIKFLQHSRASVQNWRFRKAFWAAGSLDAAAGLTTHAGPAARVARVGLDALRDADTAVDARTDARFQQLLERVLNQQIHKERRSLESSLAVLGSIGSVSPFVGLFGTVWGIMNALQDITRSGSANLEVVAGPIGEALIATAVGIAAAIPAVLAYNYFVRRVKSATADLTDFADDFLSLADRQALHVRRHAPSPEAAHRQAPAGVAQTASDKPVREAYA